MSQPSHFDLVAAARQTMLDNGFEPDLPAEVQQEAQALKGQKPTADGARDMTKLLWSSIDNDTSRDLDQIEVAEALANGQTRVMVGIADVDAFVNLSSHIDEYAETEGTTVYTGVRTFPMLPEVLSTDVTSLLEGADKLAVVIDMVVDDQGVIQSRDVYRAWVRNYAQLTYSEVGPWLEGTGAVPQKLAGSADLQAQLRLQDQAAQALLAARTRHGALNIDSIESEPVIDNGQVTGLRTLRKNRASQLIEDFMIAANSSMAKSLAAKNVPSLRRVVRTPERWDRIVELARQHGEQLPATPDSGALNAFLMKQREKDPIHAPDLSLAVMKLMGPGEYVLEQPGQPEVGHFGLAVQSYTHSTAPNRRYADLVTQRLLKASLNGGAAPYTDEELDSIAKLCTRKEDAARKVERTMAKRIAAVALSGHVGETFDGVVTGVTPNGTYVRILHPPVEGRVMRGERGLDVGDRVQVQLLGVDPQRGFIDFGR